ncbi:MAG: FecR family protein [Candidatus Rokuibacteriota bacterium]
MDSRRRRGVLVALTLPAMLLAWTFPAASQGSEVGRVKVSLGAVWIERAGSRLPAPVGTVVREADVVVTGPDGAVGITFADDGRLSVGPDSTLAIDRFAFDPTTHQGGFDSSLRKGTLAVVSGKLARQSPDAMTVKTPAAILGVRGTRFLVRTAGATP